jgi:hypothetical protein
VRLLEACAGCCSCYHAWVSHVALLAHVGLACSHGVGVVGNALGCAHGTGLATAPAAVRVVATTAAPATTATAATTAGVLCVLLGVIMLWHVLRLRCRGRGRRCGQHCCGCGWWDGHGCRCHGCCYRWCGSHGRLRHCCWGLGCSWRAGCLQGGSGRVRSSVGAGGTALGHSLLLVQLGPALGCMPSAMLRALS